MSAERTRAKQPPAVSIHHKRLIISFRVRRLRWPNTETTDNIILFHPPGQIRSRPVNVANKKFIRDVFICSIWSRHYRLILNSSTVLRIVSPQSLKYTQFTAIYLIQYFAHKR